MAQSGRDEVEALHLRPPLQERRPENEVGQLLLTEANAVEGKVKVDRHVAQGRRPPAGAGLEVLPARRLDEAVEVEPLSFELQSKPRLVRAHRARAPEPECRAAVPSF